MSNFSRRAWRIRCHKRKVNDTKKVMFLKPPTFPAGIVLPFNPTSVDPSEISDAETKSVSFSSAEVSEGVSFFGDVEKLESVGAF